MNVIIVGGGKVGLYVATMLSTGGDRVQLIEVRRERITHLQRELPADRIVLGSGSDPGVLEAVGIRGADVVAAVTGVDEVNLVVTSLARFEFGVARTIALVNDPRNAWMFTVEMGVDVVLDQADLIGHLIAEEMSLGRMTILLKLRKGQYALVEERVATNAVAAGKAVRDLVLPSGYALAAIFRSGQLLIPKSDTVLQPADEVLAVVGSAQAAQLAVLLD